MVTEWRWSSNQEELPSSRVARDRTISPGTNQGVENEYQETVEFVRINASTSEGSEIFDAYSLFGHPSYLILDDTGKVLWQSVGEQSVDMLENALKAALKK